MVRLYAVITGDLIKSSELKKEYGENYISCLKTVLEDLKDEYNKRETEIKKENSEDNQFRYQFRYITFRGDSFQILLSEPEESLKDAIRLRLKLLTCWDISGKIRFDARIAVGIGTIDYFPTTGFPGEIDGEAFQNSGLSLDQMKNNNQNLVINTPWPEFNQFFETDCISIDRFISKYTKKQAEAVLLTLEGLKQEQIKEKLNLKSQSVVSYRLKETNVDLLLKVIERYSKNIHEKVSIYERFSDKESEAQWYVDSGIGFSENGNYSLALEYFNKGLAQFQIIDDKSGEASTLNQIAFLNENLGNLEKAVEQYKKSLTIFEDRKDLKGKATQLNNIAAVFRDAGDFKKALEILKEALKIDEEIKNFEGMGTRLNNIGYVYLQLEDQEKALEYFKKALEISNDIKDLHGMSAQYNNIGVIYGNSGDKEAALNYFHKALEKDEELMNLQGIATNLSNIGSTYQELKDFEKALKYFQRALSIDEEIKYHRGIAVDLNNIGCLFVDLGDLDKALENFQKALKINKSLKDEINSKKILERINFINKIIEKKGIN